MESGQDSTHRGPGGLYAGIPDAPPHNPLGGSCYLYLNLPMFLVSPLIADGAGSSSWSLIAPPGSAGFTFGLQGYLIDVGGGLSLSNGLSCVIQL